LSKRLKKPSSSFKPSAKKSARGIGKGGSSEDERITWHINTLDIDGPWGWKDIDPTVLWDTLLHRLSNFETMKWSEIKADKKYNHSIPISDLSPAAQRRLTDIEQDDIDELFSLRLSGQERVFGIRERHILKLLWWDPRHEVCKSTKRHT